VKAETRLNAVGRARELIEGWLGVVWIVASSIAVLVAFRFLDPILLPIALVLWIFVLSRGNRGVDLLAAAAGIGAIAIIVACVVSS